MADAEIDISVVSPTQAAVEQAKSELEQENTINKARKRKYIQSGGVSRGLKRKIKKILKKKLVRKKIKRKGG